MKTTAKRIVRVKPVLFILCGFFKDPVFIKLLGNGIRWAATGN